MIPVLIAFALTFIALGVLYFYVILNAETVTKETDMAVLLKIIAALLTVANSPMAQKVILCMTTQSGWPAILSCILGVTPTTPEETTAHATIVAAIREHVAANP